MVINVVRIGNSRGIRIPKRVLADCGIGASVELRARGRKIILEPVARKVREGWEEAAKRARTRGDDALLIPDVFVDDVDPEGE